MMKFDVKTAKIVYVLDSNSRQSNADIAKKVGLSKQVVGYRIKQIMEQNLLSSCHTVIDIAKLGFTVHKNFLRLQNLTPEKEKELVQFLVQHPNVVWVASCEGKFDLAFGTWARDMAFLDATLKELEHKFGQYISERQIATIIRGEYFIREYLLGKKESTSRQESAFGSVPEPVNMDELDWRILSILSTNARMTAVEIAKMISKSADLVHKRIKKLEKSGVIKQYNIVPNEDVYPFLHFKVLIGLRNLTEEKENKLLEFCRMHSNIVYVVKSLGPWEFEIDVEIEDNAKFREFMMQFKTEFNDIIQDYSTLHIYQVWKYNFCPSVQIV